MANIYNQWVPTAAIHLPIDTYLKTAEIGEKKIQGYYDELSGTFDKLASVEPFSANAAAAYDEAMGKLKSTSQELAKSNLKSPEAYRKYLAAIGDPQVGQQISKVYEDYMNATKLQADMKEYQKKNPSVNLARFYEKINQAKAEGTTEPANASKFDYTRFRNLDPMVDYVDVGAEIDKRVHDLTANKDEVKEPSTGEVIWTRKRGGLDEERIRRYVTNQLMNDPRFVQQLKFNVEKKGYDINPYNIDKGLKDLSDQYYNFLTDQAANTQQGLTELYGNMTKEQIDKKRLSDNDFARNEITLLNATRELQRYTGPDGSFLTGNPLLAKMEREQVIARAQEQAHHDNSDTWEYDPLWLAMKKSQMAFSNAVRLKNMQKQDDLANLQAMITIPGARTELSGLTDDQKNEYLKNMGITAVRFNKDGQFNIADVNNPSYLQTPTNNNNVPVWHSGDDKLDGTTFYNSNIDKKYRGKYIPGSATELADSPAKEAELQKKGWVLIGTGEPEKALGLANTFGLVKSKKIYADPTQIYTSKDELKTGSSKRAREEIKTKISNMFVGPDRDKLIQDMDSKDPNVSAQAYQKGMATIIKSLQSVESVFTSEKLGVTDTTPFSLHAIGDNIYNLEVRKNGITKNDVIGTGPGKTDTDREHIREYLYGTATSNGSTENPSSPGKSVTRVPITIEGKGFYKVTIKGDTYYIEMLPDDQAAVAPFNTVFKQLMYGKGGVFKPVKDDGTENDKSTEMYIRQLNSEGVPQVAYVPDGFSADAQKAYAKTYDSNLNVIMKQAGVSKEKAAELYKTIDRFSPVLSVKYNGKDIALPSNFVFVDKTSIPGKGEAYVPYGSIARHSFLTMGDIFNGAVNRLYSPENPTERARQLAASPKSDLTAAFESLLNFDK